MSASNNKQWSTGNTLDPLTSPDPNTSSSHLGRRRASHSQSPKLPTVNLGAQQNQKQNQNSRVARSFADSSRRLSPSPSSASSPRGGLHPSNPFSARSISPSSSGLDAISREALPHRTTPPHRSHPPITNIGRSRSVVHSSTRADKSRRHQRSHSSDIPGALPPRHPGDLTHRPLEMIRQQTRAADKLRRPRRISDVDTIDALDTIGGAYHHGGPFDATLASRNLNKKYSPVAAVQESNEEAIRATPREFIKDSLERHMPLQGVATIPVGQSDMSGTVMDYREGSDLMREPDAAGGAYKRWDGIRYHADDLKGKGEPSYTYERDQKQKAVNEYEMQSGVNGDGMLGPAPRMRSSSHADRGSSSANAYMDDNSGLQRSHSTGKKVSEGLKRRFGSLRRKKIDSGVTNGLI